MKTAIIFALIVISAFATATKKSTTPKKATPINIVFQDKPGKKAGFCSVYVNAPAGSKITASKVTATKLFSAARGQASHLVRSTQFSTVVSHLLGDLKSGAKAVIEVKITKDKHHYDCKFSHQASSQCNGKIAHTCKPKSGSILNALMALFALAAVFAL